MARAAAGRWPGIRFETRALRFPGSGRLHADRAVAALQHDAAARGAVVRHSAKVSAIEVFGEDKVLVHTEGETYCARRVVAAVNAWAPSSSAAWSRCRLQVHARDRPGPGRPRPGRPAPGPPLRLDPLIGARMSSTPPPTTIPG
ncbi:FAD-dependent oxidoreductase [Dactylosporangium sp. CA-139114]|uniref:FAD-dependent oxidoreductase n=1 Tax=Dactylosporangium sp. CA-139114 TaxID=3239931 RepID=UPI003D956538